MTQEDKSLLLRDLCARLPYGVMIRHDNEQGKSVDTRLVGYNGDWFNYYIDNLCYHLKVCEFKPYFRPMSSMTEEEKKHCFVLEHEGNIEHPNGIFYRSQDYLNSIHIDYRGLIEKGLALEAPEGMYNCFKKT